MVVSASHFKEVTNGYERQSDGLWVHRGVLSVGPTGGSGGLPGDINASRGNGTGAYFFGGFGNKYLFYDGTQFQFAGGKLKVDQGLVAGTAQAAILQVSMGGPAWSTPQVGVWYETPVQGTATFSGALCRVEYTITFNNTGAGQLSNIGIGMDGVLWSHTGSFTHATAGAVGTHSAIVYFGVSAGVHRFGVFFHASGGVQGFHGNTQLLYVTEQRA